MFILIQSIIYITYLYLDISSQFTPISSILKFISIFLCFLQISYAFPFIKIIMALTVVADFFLVLTDNYTIGIFFFILVQTGYYILLCPNKQKILPHLSITTFWGAITSVIINIVIAPIDINVFLAAVYFCTLISNIHLSARRAAIHPEYKTLMYAFILIICCDIHVGITNLLSSGLWYNFVQIAMWLFYLPSQVIIAQLYSTKSQNQPYFSRIH